MGVAIVVVAIAGLGYLALVIAVLSQVRTPLPWWAIPLFLGILPFGIAIPVLRSWRAHLVGTAAQAHIAETIRILDEIEAEGRG